MLEMMSLTNNEKDIGSVQFIENKNYKRLCTPSEETTTLCIFKYRFKTPVNTLK